MPTMGPEQESRTMAVRNRHHDARSRSASIGWRSSSVLCSDPEDGRDNLTRLQPLCHGLQCSVHVLRERSVRGTVCHVDQNDLDGQEPEHGDHDRTEEASGMSVGVCMSPRYDSEGTFSCPLTFLNSS